MMNLLAALTQPGVFAMCFILDWRLSLHFDAWAVRKTLRHATHLPAAHRPLMSEMSTQRRAQRVSA